MPAALTVDWSAVKATAVALNSIKRAAEQHGVTYEAARVRACRETWPVGRRPAKAVQQAKAVEQAQLVKVTPEAVTSVTSTADALSTALAEDSNATKTGFSRMARRVAEAAAGYQAPKALKNSRALRDVATIAGQVHGWDAKTGDDRRVMINIGILTQ
jgi:hypothetical protein